MNMIPYNVPMLIRLKDCHLALYFVDIVSTYPLPIRDALIYLSLKLQ